MLFIVAAAGIIGAILLGVVGLSEGSAGEPYRILALACLFGAAASLLGARLDDGIRAGPVDLRDAPRLRRVALRLATWPERDAATAERRAPARLRALNVGKRGLSA